MSTTSTSTVWIQLYIGDVKTGPVFDVTDFEHGGNVSALTKAVWTKKQDRLKQSSDAKDSTELNVYAAGTAVPIGAGTEALDPRGSVSEHYVVNATLIVWAPPPLPQQQNKIPSLPEDKNSNSPSLLLYDLENNSHKQSDAYKYIDRSQTNGPIGIYGTSGAGKTRTAFEYLAQNYGYYFVVDKTLNPGSWDVTILLHEPGQQESKERQEPSHRS
eukprot:scaffold124113_cov55-Attheya_sp.AAC.2